MRRLALLLLSALFCSSPAFAEGLSDKDRELFEWFEQLNLPSMAGKAYVKVDTGEFQRGCCRVGPGQSWRYGFLLAEDKTSFTVVHDLWPVTYPKEAKGAAVRQAPSFEKLDLHKELTRRLSGTERIQPVQVAWSHLVRACGRPSQNLGSFLLARAAMQNGHEAEAAKLLEQARGQVRPAGQQQLQRWARIRRQPQVKPMQAASKIDLEELLRKELPRVILWAAIDCCGQPELGRAELAERFRILPTQFPEADQVSAAQAYVEELERMIVEDQQREESLTSEPRAELDAALRELEAPVAELIYSLRDLHLDYPSMHGSPNGHLLAEGSISAQLLSLGTVAVPRLLEVAEDPRLTRVVNCYPRLRGEPGNYVLRYGDVALQILSRLSGRVFLRRQEAAEWWEQVQRYGQLEVLDRMVREGGQDALTLANRLLMEDRERAIEAAMASVVVLRGRTRERMVSFVAAQQGARVRAFLLQEVRRGPDLRARLTAARTLDARGCSLWAEPLVAELRRQAQVGAGPNSRNARDSIRFVVQNGTPLSLEALRRAYVDFSPDEKRYLLEAAASLPRDHSDRAALGESVIVAALDDTIVYPSTWAWSGVRVIDAPIAEIAAVILAKRLDLPFEQSDPPYARRRRMIELGNMWRASRGIAARPLPDPPPGPPEADPEALAAAEDVLDAARRPEEVELAMEAYRALGLGGLSSLQAKVAERLRSPDPQVRVTLPQLRMLTFSLASTVTQVRVTDAAGLLGDEDVARFQSLLGKPLTAEDLVAMLATEIERQRATLEVNLHRDGSGRGVTVEFTLQGLERPRPTTQVVYSLRIGKSFQRGSHYLPPSKARTGWARFESRIRKLFEGRPEIDGELRLRLGPR